MAEEDTRITQARRTLLGAAYFYDKTGKELFSKTVSK